jgi:hypothetical protein
MPNQDTPSLTLIGSPNFGMQEVNAAAAENNGFESLETEEKVLVTCSGLTGQRSETRDIEAQAAIVTDNADLRRALAQVCTSAY